MNEADTFWIVDAFILMRLEIFLQLCICDDIVINAVTIFLFLFRLEKIEACTAALKLWQTLIYDGNYQFFHCRIQKIYIALALSYGKLQKRSETIEALKNALYHAKCYDTLPEGEQHYTSIFVKAATSDASGSTKNYTFTNTDDVMRFKKNKVFDFIREDAEFLAIGE